MLARRQYKRLTAREVTKLATQPGWHNDGDGLYLRVAKTGAAGWVWRYLSGKRERYMGLGPLRHVGLAEARQLADEARKLKRTGIDPIEARRNQQLAGKVKIAKQMTFKQCAEMYVKAQAAGWRSPIHARQWWATLEQHVYPVFGDLPVAAIDTGLVMQALKPMWGTKTETASRVRGRIEVVLNWAATCEYRPKGDNPARWRGHLENLLPKPAKAKKAAGNGREHHAALPYAEIGAFMVKLRQQDGVAARALEFAVLTAARSGEVRGATWDEIKLAEKMWVIPAARMKAGKEHRVPLSDAALAIIEKMAAIRTSDLIFPGRDAGKPIGPVAMMQVLQRMKRNDLTIHGFRSSFRDWAGETTHYPREVAEMALAHNVGTAVEQAYARGDMVVKRRNLMADWAGYCDRLPDERGTVVAFGR